MQQPAEWSCPEIPGFVTYLWINLQGCLRLTGLSFPRLS